MGNLFRKVLAGMFKLIDFIGHITVPSQKAYSWPPEACCETAAIDNYGWTPKTAKVCCLQRSLSMYAKTCDKHDQEGTKCADKDGDVARDKDKKGCCQCGPPGLTGIFYKAGCQMSYIKQKQSPVKMEE